MAMFRAVRDDLVLDAVWVLEEERVVACGLVLRILSGRRDNKSADRLDFVVKPVNLGAGFGSKCKMMQRAGSAPMNRLAPKSPPRRCDGEREKRVAVLHHEEVVLFDRRTRSTFFAEAKQRKKQVVERHGHRDIANRYLDVIDDRLHGCRFGLKAIRVLDDRPRPDTVGLNASLRGIVGVVMDLVVHVGSLSKAVVPEGSCTQACRRQS